MHTFQQRDSLVTAKLSLEKNISLEKIILAIILKPQVFTLPQISQHPRDFLFTLSCGHLNGGVQQTVDKFKDLHELFSGR